MKKFSKNEFDEVDEIWCDRANSSSPSFLIVRKSDRYGLWSNQREKWLLSCQFSRIEPIYEDLKGNCFYESLRGVSSVSLFKVFRDDNSIYNRNHVIYDSTRERFIYDNGESRLSPIVSLGKVRSFYVATDHNKAGILDREGKEICPVVYDSYCSVSIPDLKDHEPHLFGQLEQSHVLSYKLKDENDKYIEFLYYVLPQNGRFFLFDERGNQVLSSGFNRIELILSRTHHFEYLGMPNEGLDIYFRVVSNNKYGLYDSYGKEIFPCVYDKLEYVPSMDIVIVKRDGFYQIHNMDNVFDNNTEL